MRAGGSKRSARRGMRICLLSVHLTLPPDLSLDKITARKTNRSPGPISQLPEIPRLLEPRPGETDVPRVIHRRPPRTGDDHSDGGGGGGARLGHDEPGKMDRFFYRIDGK
jgi:hypothetical protein